MARLNIERQQRLEPEYINYANKKLTELGYTVTQIDKRLEFEYKGNTIKLFPYSGWFSGKGIKDGRGLNNLINQLK